MTTPKLIEVSAGLVFRGGKLLLTQRRPGDHLGGLWEFPGGKREAGETFEQCLVRELREELGANAIVSRLLDQVTHTYPEKTVHLRFFHCALAAGSPEPEPLHCHALVWVTKAGIADYTFPAADARLLEKLQSRDDWWR